MDQTPKQSAPIQVTEPAVLAMTFLERAPLKGIEVEYYAQTYNWLHSIVGGEFQVLTTKLFESLRATNTGKDARIAALEQEVNELNADLEKEYGDLLDKVCEISDEDLVGPDFKTLEYPEEQDEDDNEVDVTPMGSEERVTISAIEEPEVTHTPPDQLEDVESEADDESE